MSNFLHWQDFEGSKPDKFYKTNLWQGAHLMVGLNCLEPGQVQPTHSHDGADKFYFVLSGTGDFSVGDDHKTVGPGLVVIAPAGIPHGVTNTGEERLSLLVTIAPGFK